MIDHRIILFISMLYVGIILSKNGNFHVEIFGYVWILGSLLYFVSCLVEHFSK